jgi:hypothetical protein
MHPEGSNDLGQIHNDGQFPDFIQDFWCDKGHLVQAIACEATTGWQVLIMNDDGDELFSFWYTTKRVLVEVTDWTTGARVWAP